MTLRTYLAVACASLFALGGCDDHAHDDDPEHMHTSDGGAACEHTGTVVACDEEVDTVGATASAGGTTVEVTGADPEQPMAGADHSQMLMLEITDADGNTVDGATLASVYTDAHGGHESCGMPALEQMDDGMYHLSGVTYPHGGTWHHALVVGDEEIDLQVCVMNEEGAEAGEHSN